MIKKRHILILSIILSNILFSQKQESIIDKIEIAESYYEAGLIEDAISIYNNILDVQKTILGPYHLELVNTLYKLSDIYYNINELDKANECLENVLKIQYNNFLKEQTHYISTYNKIKNVYSDDSTRINQIDSILSVLSFIQNDTVAFPLNQLKSKYPKIIYLKKQKIDSTALVSKYTNNDQALEFINTGHAYLEAKLYLEAISAFDSAFKINADIINADYLLQLNYRDSTVINALYNTLHDINEYDSTITTHNLLLGLLDIKTYQDIETITNRLNMHLTIHQNDIRAYLILGNLYFDVKNYFDSMTYYFHAELIDRNNIHAKYYLALSLIGLEKYEDALLKLNEIISLDKYNYLARFHAGKLYLMFNEYSLAEKILTDALLINSNDDNIYYYLGVAYRKQGKNKQALDAFKESINLNPSNGDAHYALGDIYASILKPELAISEYQIANKYITSDSLNYQYGALLYKEGHFSAAMAPLRKFIILNPNNIEILIMLGDIFIKEKRYPEAIDAYTRLIDQYPNNEFYYYNIAQSYYELGNYEAAQEYYLQVLNFNEENQEILLQLGEIKNKLYAFSDAEYFLNEALLCGNISKEILFELGIAYGGQKKYLQALKVFQEAQKYSLDNPILHYQLGVVFQALSIYDLAISEYNKYLLSEKEDLIVNYMIGESYYGLQEYRFAIDFFEKSLEISNYKDIKSLYQIALCYLNLENDYQAAKYFKSVLKINPDHSSSRYNLINIYLSLNKTREAQKECDILYMLDRDLYNSVNYCLNR